MLQNVFFEISLQIGYIWLQSWSKNAKFYWKIFLLNVCGFCRENNSKNSGGDGQIFGHLVQSVELFFGVEFCREKYFKNSGRSGHLVQDGTMPISVFSILQ
jgi:hypothetical protein